MITDRDREAAEKMFPCVQPCDSHGACDGCCDRRVWLAGISHERARSQKLVEALEKIGSGTSGLSLYDRLYMMDIAAKALREYAEPGESLKGGG